MIQVATHSSPPFSLNGGRFSPTASYVRPRHEPLLSESPINKNVVFFFLQIPLCATMYAMLYKSLTLHHHRCVCSKYTRRQDRASRGRNGAAARRDRAAAPESSPEPRSGGLRPPPSAAGGDGMPPVDPDCPAVLHRKKKNRDLTLISRLTISFCYIQLSYGLVISNVISVDLLCNAIEQHYRFECYDFW